MTGIESGADRYRRRRWLLNPSAGAQDNEGAAERITTDYVWSRLAGATSGEPQPAWLRSLKLERRRGRCSIAPKSCSGRDADAALRNPRAE